MMASSGKETLDIKTVHQCNRCLGCKTLHPQASIIRLDHTNVEQHSIKFDFYTILLMENDIEDCCCCGRKAYDYSNATMVFLPPEQTFDIHKTEYSHSRDGYWLSIPICFMVPHLKKHSRIYFLFLPERRGFTSVPTRKDKIIECLREMDEELHHPIDRHSQTLISRYIELLLDYCTRFYERQFITRENKNKVLLDKTDRLLDDYIYSGKLKWEGPPTSAYCAENLKLSVAYFKDLLTFETGKPYWSSSS